MMLKISVAKIGSVFFNCYLFFRLYMLLLNSAMKKEKKSEASIEVQTVDLSGEEEEGCLFSRTLACLGPILDRRDQRECEKSERNQE